MSSNKNIWFFRPQSVYQRRYHGQYGHFMRDALMYIFTYMRKAKMLDNPEWTVKIYRREAYPFQPAFMYFTQKIFSNIKFGPVGKLPFPLTPEWDEHCGERVMKYTPHIWKKIKSGRGWTNVRDERFNSYVKWMVDPFRDYCFNKLNFKPQKKKRLLYVPRIDVSSRSNKIEHPYVKGKDYTNRYINDLDLEARLKAWCETNEYEYVHWQNGSHVPIEKQIEMYAESEIIIGPTGTDWINSYWCDSKTLLIEIIPPAEHHPGGDCETFKSEDQLEAVKVNKYNKFPKGWDLHNACERNLRIIYPEEVICHGEVGVRGMKYQINLNDDNREKILKLVNDHNSLSKTNS